MARQALKGRCVHCLKDGVSLTDDHVFPRSWYPDTAPGNVQRWTVPACWSCNQALSKVEQELLVRLAWCMDPTAPETAGLVQKGLRSIDPDAARSPKDRKRRLATRSKLHREFNAERERLGLVHPPGATHWSTNELGAIPIRAEALGKLVEKITRGVLYMELGQFVAPPLNMRIFVGERSGIESVDKTLAACGRKVAIEPGVVVWRAPLDDPLESLLSVEIWATWRIYVAVATHVRPGMATDNEDYLVEPLPAPRRL